MASKVNVRFVVMLSVVLTLVAGLAVGAAYFVLSKSGVDYEKAGDVAWEEGDYERAEKLYARAAAHDNTNLDWLAKYEKALAINVPDTQAEYSESFNQLRSIWARRAQVMETDVEAHDAYLRSIWGLSQIQLASRGSYDFLSDATESALRFYPSGSEGPERALLRYRGMMGSRLITELRETDEELIESIRADLDAALAANPADVRSLVSKARIDLALSRDNPEMGESAKAMLREFAEANPDETLASLLLLSIRAVEERSEALRDKDTLSERLEAIDGVYQSLDGEFDRLSRRVAEQGIDDVDSLEIDRTQLLRNAEQQLSPIGGLKYTERALNELIAQDGDRYTLRLSLAEIARRSDNLDRSIELFEQVRDAEDLPVSLRGFLRFFYRQQAAGLLVETAAIQWSRADTEAEEAEALAAAESYLEDLRTRVDPGSVQLTKAEGRLALMNGELDTARDKLQAVQRIAGLGDVDVTRMLAEVTLRQSQFGAAREHFVRLIEAEPGNTVARLQLAAVEAELRNYEQAMVMIDVVLAGDPNNEAANNLRDRILIASGERESEDPVTQALLEANRTLQGDALTPGDRNGAIAILERAAVELGSPPRLVFQLVQLLASSGEKDRAIAVLETARGLHPDDEGLQYVERVLTSDDRRAIGEELINRSEGEEWRKALQLAQLYRSDFDDEAAQAQLDRALELAPEQPEVIEALFIVAVTNGDMARAEQMAERAEQIDADRAQGLTYRARLRLRAGDTDQAVLLLEEAARANPNNPRILALLGNTRFSMGQPDEAEQAFRRALELRPDDVSILVDFIRGLTALSRMDDALLIARENERFGRGSPAYENLRIGLEAERGSLEYAVRAREQLAKDFPNDLDNLGSLATLYLSSARWDDARGAIDRLLAEEGSPRAIQLAARWHVDQGDPQAALTEFQDFILEVDPGEITAEPYLAFGGFMVDRGQVRLGLTAMLEARDFQTEEKMEAERALAEAYFRLSMPTEATDALKTGVENATDEEASETMRKRLVESLILIGKPDEAREYFAFFDEQAIDSDPQLKLFNAQLLTAAGDRNEARRIYDELVAANPRDADMYLARARFNREDRLLIGDALADATRAIELAPEQFQGYTLRAEIRQSQGNQQGFLEDVKSAALAAPDRPDLRNIALNELLAADRAGEAAEFARDIAAERPGDVLIVATFAELFARSGEWGRAKEMYDLAWERRNLPELAPGYVIALLEQRRPDADRAREVLRTLGSDVVTASPQLLISRVRVEAASGDYDLAGRDATAAFALLGDGPGDKLGWYNAVRDAFDDDRELEQYLVRAEQSLADPSWPALFRGELLGDSERTRQQGVSLLENLSEQAEDELVQRLASRMVGTVYANAGEHAQAVAAWQSHFERYPDDWSAANNTAYVMAKELGRFEDALPLAERAAELAPNSPDVLDTLGVILTELGQAERAEEVLRRGLEQVSERSPTSVGLRVHLAASLAASGNAEEARSLLDDAERQMVIVPDGASYQSQIDELRGQLGGTD